MHFIVSDIVLRMVAWWWYGIEWLGCGHPPSSGWSGKGGWSRHWLRMRWKYEGELKNGSMVSHIRASTDDGQWTDHQRWVKNEMKMSTRVAEGWEMSCGSDQCDCDHIVGINLCWRIFECWWDESFLIQFKCILPCSELILLNYHKWLRSFWMMYE